MANKFVVSPMIEKISLKPGETYTSSITVGNPKDATKDFYFKISLSPYGVKGEDYSPDFAIMTDWTKIVNWVTLDATEGVLKPNETRKINYTVKVPMDAPGGGQYFKIGVSSNAAAISGESGAVQNVYEMASLVFAEVDGEIRHDGKILGTDIPGFVATGKSNLINKYINDGNVHETATTKITIKNALTGEVVSPKEGEDSTLESIIMPQTTRVVARELNNLPPLGVFEVTEDISYMGTEISPSAIMIVCPAWFIFFVIAMIVSIIGMISYGKHLKKKSLKKELHSEKTNGKIEP